jgi:hypothetical protein
MRRVALIARRTAEGVIAAYVVLVFVINYFLEKEDNPRPSQI